MIQAHYVEIRSRRGPGDAEPTTIIREVHSQNGHSRKTICILRGNRVVSDVSEPLRPSEKIRSPNLYKSAKKKTRKQKHRSRRAH